MNELLTSVKKMVSQMEPYDVADFYQYNRFPANHWFGIMENIIAPLEIESMEELDGLAIVQTIEAIGYASTDGGLNFAVGAHTLASAIPILKYGSAAQKQHLLIPMLTGKLICANAITETEAGSDIFSMQSTAKLEGEKFHLKGVKTFCSNIVEADLAIVYVKTDAEKGAHGGISAFILEKQQLKVGQTYSKMGLRTCSIGELLLDGVAIDESQILGQLGAGLSIFTTAMDWERTGLSAIYIGTMQRLFEEALAYAKQRKQGGSTIGTYQAVSHKLAEIKTLIHACRSMVYSTAKQLDKTRAVSESASMCKWYVSETYIKVCQMAMQIFGGSGYMEELGIERCLRDAHASVIYSGTTEIQKNIIAKWSGL